jgi:hypothetical protein
MKHLRKIEQTIQGIYKYFCIVKRCFKMNGSKLNADAPVFVPKDGLLSPMNAPPYPYKVFPAPPPYQIFPVPPPYHSFPTSSSVSTLSPRSSFSMRDEEIDALKNEISRLKKTNIGIFKEKDTIEKELAEKETALIFEQNKFKSTADLFSKHINENKGLAKKLADVEKELASENSTLKKTKDLLLKEFDKNVALKEEISSLKVQVKGNLEAMDMLDKARIQAEERANEPEERAKKAEENEKMLENKIKALESEMDKVKNFSTTMSNEHQAMIHVFNNTIGLHQSVREQAKKLEEEKADMKILLNRMEDYFCHTTNQYDQMIRNYQSEIAALKTNTPLPSYIMNPEDHDM